MDERLKISQPGNHKKSLIFLYHRVSFSSISLIVVIVPCCLLFTTETHKSRNQEDGCQKYCGAELKQTSPTSPLQHCVKCETLHQKYFETVAYADASFPDGHPYEGNEVKQTLPTSSPPTCSPAPTFVESSCSAGCQGNSELHTSNPPADLATSTSTFKPSTRKSPVSPLSGKSLPNSSQTDQEASRLCQSKKPLETNFPVEPVVIIDKGKPADKVFAIVPPPPPAVEKIKKKGIKTTPLLKTTLRTSVGRPKSPLVARVTRPAIAIKTTVGVDTKPFHISDKPKETSKVSPEEQIKRKTDVKDSKPEREEKETAVTERSSEKESVEDDITVENSRDVNQELTVINEEVTGPDFKEYIGYCFIRDKTNLDEYEAASDSIRVNVDSDSVNTLTDPIDEDFCTQYSAADSEEEPSDSRGIDDSDSKEIGDSPVSNDSAIDKVGDISITEDIDDDDTDVIKQIESDKVENITKDDNVNLKDLKTELRDARINEIRAKSASLNRKSHEDPGLPFNQSRSVLIESGSRISILRNSARNRSFDSEYSPYASFYSIDNGSIETSICSKSRKLKWTPRILSESRFSSANSGTFSDCASFYTADTCGTFYSARSFQLDSLDDFQTCDDFQKIDLTPKSKLGKAKDALLRGKDFVKAKFENYRKRLPAFRKSDPSEDYSKSKSLCHHSCGFSCVHLGKEVSQYSLPDFSATKGDNEDNPGESECEKLNDNDDVLQPNCPDTQRPENMIADDMDTDVNLNTASPDQANTDTRSLGSASSTSTTEHDQGDDDKTTVKMGVVARETTEADDDDMPVGTEAISIPRTQRPSENGEAERPANKRLRWVSAVEKSQGTSLTSSFTSNSSVEHLLHSREMDPETFLNNLGFGADPNTEDACNKIPDRFIMNPCAARGVNLQQFVVSHPELHRLLPALERTMASTESNNGKTQLSRSESQSVPMLKTGTMQRQHTFSGVLHGMKFVRGIQSPTPPAPDEEDKRISQIPSVLDFPNRKALARQGFYGSEYVLKNRGEEAMDRTSPKPKSLSAAQRRRQFHHSSKSKSKNWSLTDESEAENSANGEQNSEQSSASGDSFDRGLMLRSFSERFSSESSLESADSYGDERRRLIKQNSISNLRKQYHETIRRSMDGEFPVFEEDYNDEESEKKLSISEVRKKQVTRLMSLEDDDGDYFAHVRQSSLKETQTASLKRAQNSTQSTVTDSPSSPNDLKFSFDNTLKDGESEFGFSSRPKLQTSPPGSQAELVPSISVIVEEDPSSVSIETSGEITSSISNPNELEAPALVLRSDSCNTLVSQDTTDNEHLEGELTPRPDDSTGVISHYPLCSHKLSQGDDVSESTGSTGTLTIGQDNIDSVSPVEMFDEDQSGTVGEGVQGVSMDTLKPAALCRPQESFELEEISSAEDLNGNSVLPKSQAKRGPMEKSASTHSDSSGFADIDPAGETTQSSITDLPKETITSSSAKPMLTKQKTLRFENHNQQTANNMTNSCHDNQTTHDATSPQQTEALERQIQTDRQAMMEAMMAPAIEETKNLYVCRKNLDKTDNKLDEKENSNPELTSISYIPDRTTNSDKSVVFTVNVPLENASVKTEKKLLKPAKRFVSKVNLKVLTSKDGSDNQSTVSERSESSCILQIGPVQHEEFGNDGDKDTVLRTDISEGTERSVEERIEVDSFKPVTKSHSLDILPEVYKDSHAEVQKPSFKMKSDVRSKQKAKEALIAATSQTADWLLSNGRQSASKHNGHGASHFNLSRPVWASTPDLKQQPSETSRNLNRKISAFKDASHAHSFDVHTTDDNENFLEQEEFLRGDNLQASRSHQISRQLPHQHSADVNWFDRSQGMAEIRRDSLASSSDESVSIPRYSNVESSFGMPEDHMHYLKLARLVNGPSLILSPDTKMPIMRYTPNLRMKNWVEAPRNMHLEEETRLMQHAVQRYEVELSVMETMLATMYQRAKESMEEEDRAEVEELQSLWREVRKEVGKMSLLLTDRLKALRAGNDSYSPLDALQIVQAMIDLLREQLYHQQMCITKDSRVHSDEPEEVQSNMSSSEISMKSASSNSAWMSDISQQISEVRDSVTKSQEIQREALNDTFSELKSSLLSEMKGELTTATNSKMLQLQLQARDNEIQRLRMELLLQNVESGKTRKRLLLESDV